MTEGECQFRLCKHPPEDHQDGSCYAITEPDKEGIIKFCKCDSQHGFNLRLYEDLKERGLPMVEQSEDFMVTKTCQECKNDFLLRRDEVHCMSCKAKLGIKEKKLHESPSWMIRKPLSQEELQKYL